MPARVLLFHAALLLHLHFDSDAHGAPPRPLQSHHLGAPTATLHCRGLVGAQIPPPPNTIHLKSWNLNMLLVWLASIYL